MGRNGILDWFKFESKEKREKRERKYYSRMYPLGEPQHDWEIATLKELFPDAGKRLQEIHFDLLVLREAIINSQLDEDDEEYESLESAMNYWAKTETTRAMIKSGKAHIIKAMGILENEATSMDGLPSVELILKESEKYKVQ